MEEELASSNRRLVGMAHDVVEAMGKVVEARDPYTQGHELRVAKIGRAIAEQLGLPPDTCDLVETAGLIHDIGKLAVPVEILTKPGRLTAAEFALVKGHAVAGHLIVRGIETFGSVAQVILQHHERADGSGYPEGLKGDEILLEARILAVADVVEAMASHRPYRPALGVDAAIAEIKGNPIKYDPDVSGALFQIDVSAFVEP
jgi:putative nucleotidyltransferase with HDIG domain